MLVLTDLVKTKYPRLCLQLLRCPKDVIFPMQPAAPMSHEQSLFPKSSASLILFEKCSLHTAFWGLFSTFYLTGRNFFLRTLGLCCQRWPWLTVNWRFHHNHHKEQQKDEFKHFSMRKKRPKKTQSKYNSKKEKGLLRSLRLHLYFLGPWHHPTVLTLIWHSGFQTFLDWFSTAAHKAKTWVGS